VELFSVSNKRQLKSFERRKNVPFKSEAQKKQFEKMVKDGKISKETYAKWEKDTPIELPDRVDSRSKKIKKAKTI
jgi:hypothetical protein